MSLNITVPRVVSPAPDGERAHRLYLRFAYIVTALLLIVLMVYGADYYWASAEQRAFSPKHAYLKPSGAIGLRLGMVGFVMFLLIYLYPLRKRWAWLGRQGSSRHWLDFHVLLGLSAPVVITLHSSFKFSGIAGVAYWIMILVSLSGVVGRYLYAQIPRSINFAELSMKEAQENSASLVAQLRKLGVLNEADIASLTRLPNFVQAKKMSLLGALGRMMLFDCIFPFRVWRLRQKVVWSHTRGFSSAVGLRRGDNVTLESTVRFAKEQSQMAKKILFLSKSQEMFRLWHIIHRPFSYSFAFLATIHVVLMLMLGYY